MVLWDYFFKKLIFLCCEKTRLYLLKVYILYTRIGILINILKYFLIYFFYERIFFLKMEGLEMAKEILATPTLRGSATKAFLDDMMRPDNDKEKEIKEKNKKGNHIKFL